jgi:hypothetical protein
MALADSLQRQMSSDEIKIPIIVQERQVFADAKSGDDDVDRLSHGDSGFSEMPVIFRALNGHGVSPHTAKDQGLHERLGCLLILVRSEPLKHFSQDQVSHHDGNTGQKIVETICLP